MKIIVCVKRVPDTASKLKVTADDKSIDNSELEHIISPYDEYAVEHAVQIKENNEGVEIVVVCVGPPEAEKNMRNCLAMGADRGVLLETDRQLLDSFVTAKVLAATVAEEKPDLVLFGIKAVDDDNGQVGAMVSTLADMPFIEGGITLELGQGVVKAKREVEGGNQTVEASVPCALSINKGGVEPRICSLINIRKARKKEIKKVPAQLLEPAFEVVKLELPPARQGGKIIGQGSDALPKLFQLLREEAKVL